VGLLVICTARPELVQERPGWGDKENGTTFVPLPLSKEETGELVTELAGDAISTETATAIVGAASGNPLYAVELARMFKDRGPGPGRSLPIPESIQGLIAARIDSLSADEKALLQDAAVVGKVVWPGALAAVGDPSRRSVQPHLGELVRKEFLTQARPSSVEREREYRFRHVLVRDVAYAQIPRTRRGEAHRRAAAWLETLSPDRTTDRVEMLAHHYLSSYELAVADGAETTELSERARVLLREAGDRALSLNSFPAAARYFRKALELWPESDSERPALLLGLGKARYYADNEGADVLSEAEDGLLAAGDRAAAAEAAMYLADLAHQRGEPQERVFEHAGRALTLVDGLEASRSTVDVLVEVALMLGLAGDHGGAIKLAEEALRDAETLSLQELQARALGAIGISRGLSGDSGGRDDLRRSIGITEQIGSSLGSHHCGMLADLELNFGNLRECFELQARARRHAERFGHAAHIQWLKGERVAECYWTGRWDQALILAREFVSETEAGSEHFMEGYCRHMRGKILLARGEVAGALDDAARALAQARTSNEPQMLYPALAFRARALQAADEPDEAAQVADELMVLWRSKLNDVLASSWVVDLLCALGPLGRGDELLAAADAVVAKTAWLDAATAFTRGEFEAAAALFGRIGSRPDEALARLHAAKALAQAGKQTESGAELELALTFYRDVEASAYLTEAEELVVA
jgi:tetratricopeptide (TPR) repeat protein